MCGCEPQAASQRHRVYLGVIVWCLEAHFPLVFCLLVTDCTHAASRAVYLCAGKVGEEIRLSSVWMPVLYAEGARDSELCFYCRAQDGGACKSLDFARRCSDMLEGMRKNLYMYICTEKIYRAREGGDTWWNINICIQHPCINIRHTTFWYSSCLKL